MRVVKCFPDNKGYWYFLGGHTVISFQGFSYVQDIFIRKSTDSALDFSEEICGTICAQYILMAMKH
ncbi:hypothetical protein SAMD00079811_59920 [Scytonema sp. HK-05]|nr:hypothetical protein NIES2130_15295 [Scytonema sp. HK-05]BAY48369.1 hypothetical protein SAMD00079811_59920 [Scytonema sp. HK-05]